MQNEKSAKNLEQFTAGTFKKGYDFRYFLPTKINYQWQWLDGTLNELVEKASIKIGELNSFAKLVPNIDLWL